MTRARSPALEATAEELRALGRMPSVYAKVSSVVRADGAFHRSALDDLWASFGPDRVIYSSNWPVNGLVAPYSTAFRVVKSYLADRGSEIVDKFFLEERDHRLSDESAMIRSRA